MTTAITKESLAARIADLEYGARSLKEDYTLAAYKMLLATMEAEPVAYSLIFRNMEGVLNSTINTNTVFATREKAEAYGKGGNYEKRRDGGLEWVPNTALDPVVAPLYRHAQQPVEPVVQKDPVSFDEWSRKCALQITLCYPDFREKAQYIWDSARETQHVVPVVPEEPPEHLLPKGNSRDTTYRRGAIILGWKLCRAAMLNGGKP